MAEGSGQGRRLYKARTTDGEVAWVDHDELWRLQQELTEGARRRRARRRRWLMVCGFALLFALLLAGWRLGRPWGAGTDRAVAAASGTAQSPPASASPATDETAADETIADAPAADATAADETAADAPAADATGGSEVAAGVVSGDGTDGAAAPPAPRVEPAPPPSTGEGVEAAVRRWAAAWERRDVAAYLAAYAAGFEPPGGLSAAAWRSLRRRRLLDPPSIRVRIEGLEIVTREGGVAEARFVQRYDSPEYADVVRKRLELVREEGEWRILREEAEPVGF